MHIPIVSVRIYRRVDAGIASVDVTHPLLFEGS